MLSKQFIRRSGLIFAFRSGLLLLLALISTTAFAHGVDGSTRSFPEQNTGVQFVPFLYIGAKHMLTGYDHLLFLVGGEQLIWVGFCTTVQI